MERAKPSMEKFSVTYAEIAGSGFQRKNDSIFLFLFLFINLEVILH